MYKKIITITILLFVALFLLTSCCITHHYNNKEVKAFKKYILANYKDIDAIEVNNFALEFRIVYVLKTDISDEEMEKIFKKTREYLKMDSFIKAINKEAQQDTFFTEISIWFKNSPNSRPIEYKVRESSNLEIWVKFNWETGESEEKKYGDK